MSDGWTIGIIGGSGLYAIDGLEDAEWRRVDTPWGQPSDELLFGRIGNVNLVFLPRHGRGHVIPPSELNFRANVDALKRSGVTDILAISSIGSLEEDLPPGHFVVVDQFIDRTVHRVSSFFGAGMVAHVSMAYPVCERLSGFAAAAVEAAGGKVATGATYLAMEGPQFSTRAESLLYRYWGADVIGMVTDYDCWRESEAPVEVAEVIAQMHKNGEVARRTVEAFVNALPSERTPSPIDTCLDVALITDPARRDPALLAKLDAVAGRALRR